MTQLAPVQQFLSRVEQHPNKVYLRQPVNGVWNEYTWAQVAEQVARMAAALQALGIKRGDVIATSGRNTAHWIMGDLAALSIGACNVGLYPKMSAEHIEFVLKHCGAKALLINPAEDVANVAANTPAGVIKIAAPYEEVTCEVDHQWDDLIQQHDPLPQPIDPSPDDLATLIYTSGTTGDPKGVELRVGGVQWAMTGLVELLGSADPEPRWFSYLPLAHVFERGVVGLASLYMGAEISFLENLNTFQRDLVSVAPTRMVGVPLIWQRLQAGILQKMPEKKLRRLLKVPILNNIVKNKIKEGLGLQNCTICVSGAAPLSPATIEFFTRLGLPISQGYGMSENMAYTSIDYPPRPVPGSVGKALPGCETQITDDGELLIRHPAVFTGYYKSPEKTAETITADGWMHTGDRARIDDEGYIFITGRVKDLFKTDKGKYVSPVPIETKLGKNGLIESLCLIGSGQKQPVMILTTSEAAKDMSDEEVAASIEADVAALNETLENHEFIAKTIVSRKPWTIEDGHYTPTMKVRRHFIEELFTDQIPTWYASDSEVIWI